MGLILDSSVLIQAERQGQNARQMLTAISGTAGNTDIAISVVTLIELAHGAARADTAQRKAKLHQFIQELLTAVPIHPVCGELLDGRPFSPVIVLRSCESGLSLTFGTVAVKRWEARSMLRWRNSE